MDLFESTLNRIGIKVNLSGDTYESEQRYRLIVAGLCFALGFLYMPFTLPFWAVTVIKLLHFSEAYLRKHNG